MLKRTQLAITYDTHTKALTFREVSTGDIRYQMELDTETLAIRAVKKYLRNNRDTFCRQMVIIR